MSAQSPALLRVAGLIDSLNALLGKTFAWLTLFLVLGTSVVVVLRYGFGVGATALQEAVLYAHALVFMGATAWVLQRNGHVLVELLGNLFLLLPVCLFLGWASWDYVANSWATREGSSESGGLKFVFLQKSIILVLVATLVLQGLSDLIKSVYQLAGRLPQNEVKHG
jgi:TRAP-type mannitol/chloroaromatic compound transport system permease small subunit